MNGKSGFRLASILQTIDSENILVDEGWYNQDKHEYFLKNNINVVTCNKIACADVYENYKNLKNLEDKEKFDY